jgi:hypothetical protein
MIYRARNEELINVEVCVIDVRTAGSTEFSARLRKVTTSVTDDAGMQASYLCLDHV